jgi:uncharacterized protein (DUF58 family)
MTAPVGPARQRFHVSSLIGRQRGLPGPPPTAAPVPVGGSSFRTRAYDRVGGSRLTGLGSALVMAVLIAAASPPRIVDHAVLGAVWVALATFLVLGIAWPLIAVRLVRVSATSPRDVTVGDTVALDVVLHGRSPGCEVRALDPTGRWHAAQAPGAGKLPHLADHRGVFHLVRVELRVTGPLGVLAAHRVHNIVLTEGVEVAPRPLEIRWLPAPAPIEGSGEPVTSNGLGVDLVRSVRPYTQGDPARLVHWPSTARTGDLVVREMEPPAPHGQAIVVDLRNLGPDTERAAGYGLGAALAVLAAGGDLVVCTCEPSGPVTGRVRHPIDARRRLARAVVGPPGEPPPGWPVVEIGT